MKAKDIKIGAELLQNPSADWALGQGWTRKVVVLTELGHWYRKDGKWVKSAYKTHGFRYESTYGVVVRLIGSKITAESDDQERVCTLGSLRGDWAECDALVQANRQRKADLQLAQTTKADAQRRRNNEVIVQAADLGISGWAQIATSSSGRQIGVDVEILSKMLTALAEQGWVLPVE